MNDAGPEMMSLFHAALERPAPERAGYLDSACGTDRERRERIEALLRAHEQAGRFLPESAAADWPTTDQPGVVLAGRYKLLEEIGEGGMGTVWMAQQTEPVKRLVAVKLIKAGMDSKSVLARFEAERQALALMDHPNIARVLDAGTTPDQRPFFVMELVKGVPITKYCDEQRLTPRQRLELFIPVCQAIQHAHQKGIIHRDIKPSNVLIARYDDRPMPRVIDFGVAKATGQELTEQTLHTGFGAVVGTLEYMSPEQASFNQLDVDTRSDIYSLGVLLYELLVGSPPFTRQEMEQEGILGFLRAIREQEPTRPSTRLSTAEGLPTLAVNRGTEPRRLSALVRGEVDWIVMKALEKDRNRRYETANGFALDVQRYLDDEPVLACPPSMGYRLGKFLRRYRAFLSAASAVVLILIAGIVVSTWQANRAATAEQATRIESEEKDTALEAEQSALAREAEQRQRAEDNLDLALTALGEVYFKTGSERILIADDHGQVDREFLQTGLMFYEEFIRKNRGNSQVRLETAKAYFAIGKLRRDLGQLDRADRDLNQAITLLTRLVDEGHPDPMCRGGLAMAYYQRGWLRQNQNRWPEAIADYREALKRMERLAAEPSAPALFLTDSGWMSSALANALLETGEVEEALPHALAAIRFQEASSKKEKDQLKAAAHLAWHYSLLGGIHRDLGKTADAESAGRQALALFERLTPIYREYLSGAASAHVNLARLYHQTRRLKKAEEHWLAAAGLYQKEGERLPNVFGTRHALGWCHLNLGRVRLDDGRLEEADGAFAQAEAIQRDLLKRSPTRPLLRAELARTLSNRGTVLQMQKRPREAEPVYRAALKLWREAADRGEMQAKHQPTRRRVREHHPATEPTGQVLIIPAGQSAPHDRTAWAGVQHNLAMVLRDRGRLIEATRLWEQALRNQEAALELMPENREFLWQLGQICVGLAETLMQREQWPAAARYFDKWCRLRKADDPGTWLLDAMIHLCAEDLPGYRRICAELMKRFGNTKDPAAAETVVSACTLTPDAIEDRSRLVPLAELAIKGRKANRYLLGAALHRAGKYKEAIRCFEDEYRSSKSAGATEALHLALAYHRLGQRQVAREYLDMGRKAVAAGLPELPDRKRRAWEIRVQSAGAEAMLREAEALLKVKK